MNVRSKWVACFAIGAIAIAGCSTRPNEDSPRGAISPTTRSQTVVPDAFLHLHKLAFAPLALSDAIPQQWGMETEARATSLQQQEFQLRFEMVADEELALETVPSGALLEKIAAPVADRATLVRAAEQAGADGLLVARLNQFRERQGSSLGSEAPARVDLEMEILRTSDSLPVWKGSYHYEDAALFDNLLRAKQKFGERGAPSWYSANAVLWTGMRSLLRDIEAKRQSAFTPR